MSDITILDFGCGLAQRSRSLAAKFMADGRQVTLSLNCSEAAIPDLPPCHLCIATDILRVRLASRGHQELDRQRLYRKKPA